MSKPTDDETGTILGQIDTLISGARNNLDKARLAPHNEAWAWVHQAQGDLYAANFLLQQLRDIYPLPALPGGEVIG